MDLLTKISDALKPELDTFNTTFSKAFETEDELLQKICSHIHQRIGKQMRPIVVLLAAKLCGKVTDNTYNTAASYEILHTGSLVHDDVVDNTMQRRGQNSVNAIFNNQAAVLVGDYLLTKSMHFIYNTGNLQLLGLLVKLSEELARGELLQLQHAYSIPTEEEYYNIIRHKTASLFAVCARSGALTATDNTEHHDRLERFGELLGLCFQIKDDIFDYTPSAKIGKPIMNDIREGKVTLPLLHALQQMSEQERNHTMSTISQGEITDETQTQILHIVEHYEGIAYATQRMEHFSQLAKEELTPFDNNEIKQLLFDLLDYVKDRKL
ncbi:MAG: polyprenyl synthetase family protein [Bacteroidales bacterium]|nr:polyprenyl synthetase family protein [Bacteroidales bacterium]